MSAEIKKEIQLEIAHVLFIDIVGYSKLSINEQRAAIDELTQAVRASEQVQNAEAAARLIKIPTGDGMALVFYKSPEEPVECALEISRALKERRQLRMGVHSGPVSGVIDVNGQANLAGTGLNTAQRVMDCGDAGHILLSKRVADDLGEYEQWRPLLHDLGECEVKHGMRVFIVNLHGDEVGNPQLPKKFQTLTKHRARMRRAAITAALLALSTIVAGVAMFSLNRARSILSAPEKSVAVLPFENLSSDKENAYFADGIQDEILTRLSKIADLKVISRTSTQHYKSAPENLPEIARQLGVANIVEGSVQKSGDAVRVNVQLIKAANDSHLWADTFDRKLTDIFSVESEVAKAIADQLRAKLTGSEEKEIAARPTENPQAYDAYLRGLAIVASYSDSSTSLDKSLNFFAEAVRLDPNFALAWVRLSANHSRIYWVGYDRTPKRQEEAKQAVDRALQLQPDLGEAFLALGYFYYWCRHDFDAASTAFEQARARLPNNPEILAAVAYIERRKGKWSEAIAHQDQAVQLSPRDLNTLVQFAISYETLKRFPEAHALVERVLNISPDHAPTLALSARLYLAEGNVERAEGIMHSVVPTPAQAYIFEIQVRLALITHRYPDAIKLLDGALSIPETASAIGFRADCYRYLLGFAKQLAGDVPGARAAYEMAAANLERARINQADTPEAAMYLGFAYAALGEKDKALRAAREAVALNPATKDSTLGPAYEEAVARVHARLGDVDEAIAEIERLLAVNYLGPEQIVLTPAMLRLDPVWDPLRGDPRFQKIVASSAPK